VSRRRAIRAALALALCLGVGACSVEPGPGAATRPAPTLRFECTEGCGTYKTVRAGETPPPCCGAPMELLPEEGLAGERAAGR